MSRSIMIRICEVTCEDCRTSMVSPLARQFFAYGLRQLGWHDSAEKGWVCKDCYVKLKQPKVVSMKKSKNDSNKDEAKR